MARRLVCALTILVSWIGALPAPAAAFSSSAGSSILEDRATGQILFERNSHQQRSVASTTKIITALVVLRNTRPTDTVTATANAERVGNNDPAITEIGLTNGESLQVEPLLYAMLLASASDAAVALAEHVGGSIPGFVSKMNALGTSLGAKDSHFENPHGLDQPGNYSSAYDLARFARAALSDPEFQKIVATSTYTLMRGGKPQTIKNRNHLLENYAGADGVKTGQTLTAGHSLVASATRAGEGRVSVVLDSDDPFGESARLLDFGFSAFHRYRAASAGAIWGHATYGEGTTRAIIANGDLSLLLATGASPPRVEFIPKEKKLQFRSSSISIWVPAHLRCETAPCASAAGSAPKYALAEALSPLSSFLELLAGFLPGAGRTQIRGK